MACMDVLPLEIVHAIVARVNTRDLLAIALVSHFFNGVANMRIYAEVRYTRALVEKWEKVSCPLKLLSSRSGLLVCLKSLEIHDVPKLRQDGAPPRDHPEFMRTCLDVVKRAPALASFSRGKNHNNGHYYAESCLRIFFDQLISIERPPCLDASLLIHLGLVEHIYLYEVSRDANEGLVEWARQGPKPCLTSLSISENYFLELAQLRQILEHTPNLKSLSIMDCPTIVSSEFLALIHHFELKSLGFDVSKGTKIDDLNTVFPIIPALRHISLDISAPLKEIRELPADIWTNPIVDQLLLQVLECFNGIELHSLTLRLTSISRAFTHKPVNSLLATHAHTLRKLHLFGFRVPAQLIATMVSDVPGLEDLGLMLREVLDDLDPIIQALPAAHYLHTLTDTTPVRVNYTEPIPDSSEPLALNDAQAEQLLRAGPALRRIVSLQFGHEWVKLCNWREGEMPVVIVITAHQLEL